MLRLVDLLFRCFYNLASAQQPPYARLASAHVGLGLLFCFALLEFYSLLLKHQRVGGYLAVSAGMTFIIICGTAACGSIFYFAQHPRSYWNIYRGDSGKARLYYALGGVSAYFLLTFLGAQV
jgi:hypothetical protein